MTRVTRWSIVGGFTLMIGVAALGQDGGTEPASDPAAPESEAPEPLSGDFDWVQFKNGEWLKGEIKDLQDDSFTFDSDEMDELSLDFDDV